MQQFSVSLKFMLAAGLFISHAWSVDAFDGAKSRSSKKSHSASSSSSSKSSSSKSGGGSFAAAGQQGFMNAQQLLQQFGNLNGNGNGNIAQASSFEGVININGRETRTNDPAEFARLQQQMGQLPMGLPIAPMAGMLNIANMANAANSNFEGVVNINGQEFRTKDPAEFARLQQQFQNQFPAFPGLNPANANAASSSSFSGTININGKVQTFTDPNAFQKAQQQLQIPGVN